MEEKSTALQFLIFISLFISFDLVAQNEFNYDETKVPRYTLEDPLVSNEGITIQSPKDWIEIRRPEILGMFEELVYGKIPGELRIDKLQVLEKNGNALSGKAHRHQVRLFFNHREKELAIDILVLLPKNVKDPGIFLAYNFYGNQTILLDEKIVLPSSWIRNNESLGISENRATEKSRGVRSHRWALEKIIDAGFGLATMYYGDIDPDRDDFSDGIHPFLYQPAQAAPKSNEWGSITAWAWGLSRALDYLSANTAIAPNKVIVMGHSRLGKTALWAGALDERFSIVISNDSGCGGAALSKRKFGETIERINTSFPHWFCDNFNSFNNNEEDLPLDQHMLISLIAPRPVYIASAEEDQWADPYGEYLSAYYATPVYELFNKKGLESKQQPKINQAVHLDIGYHIRSGKHDVTNYDWEQYINFAAKHFENTSKNISKSEVETLLNKWLKLWETYDIRFLDHIFLNSEDCTYFSSEKEGLIKGFKALIPHHTGFGFVEGGKATQKKLWLKKQNISLHDQSAVVEAIWYFGNPNLSVEKNQRGPVTFVMIRDVYGQLRIAHTNFGNY